MRRNDTLVPRLHVGKGPDDGSAMCAMQVVSWESGEREITDLPVCADPLLALCVQQVNDLYCTHRPRGSTLLCAPCSVAVLALAHRTVGTTLTGWSDEQIKRLYVRLVLDEVPADLREIPSEAALRQMIERWLDGAASVEQVKAARPRTCSPALGYAVMVIHVTDLAGATRMASRVCYHAAWAQTNRLGLADDPNGEIFLARVHALVDRFEARTAPWRFPDMPPEGMSVIGAMVDIA